MSIFSSIKRARHSTKEQPSKSSDKKKSVSPSPYRHIPTHAASDAIGVAPPADRIKDKSKVREENRKRSAMAAAQAHAQNMNMSGSRGGSGYSSGYYTSGDVSPTSYGTPNPYGSSRSGYPTSEMAYSHTSSMKGKEVDRSHYYDLASTSSSKGGRDPVGSSRNSVGSAEVLDSRRSSRPASERPSSTSRHPHRLHPTSRRTSDSSIDREKVNNTLAAATMTSQARETRPPPSTRGRGNLKPLPLVPPTQSQPPASSSGRGHSSRHSSRDVSTRRESVSSLPILTPSSTRPTSSTPATPTSRRIIVNKAEFTMVTPGRPPSLNFDFEFSGQETPTQRSYHHDGRRSSRYSGYSGHSLVDSSVEKLDFGLRRKSRSTPSPLPPDQSNGYMNGYHINAYDMNGYYHEGYYQDPREAPSPPSKPSSKDRSSKDRSSKDRSSRDKKSKDKDKKEEKEGRSRRLSLTKAGSKLKKRWSASK